AEDGIRDRTVTGVQTCALPIFPPYIRALFITAERKQQTEREKIVAALHAAHRNRNETARLLGCSRMTLYRKMMKYGIADDDDERSEERRVGKECREERARQNEK